MIVEFIKVMGWSGVGFVTLVVGGLILCNPHRSYGRKIKVNRKVVGLYGKKHKVLGDGTAKSNANR